MNREKIINQMKELCSFVTGSTYDDDIQQNYELLKSLNNLGVEKEIVYQSFLQYHNSLEAGLAQECIAEVLDYIVGWCSPEKCVWK